MRAFRGSLAAAVLVVAASVSADVYRNECATSSLQQRFAIETGAWSAARAGAVGALQRVPAPTAAMQDDIVLLPADDANAPFRRPVDLEGRTVGFVRTNAFGFRVSTGHLQWDEAIANPVLLDGFVGEEQYGRVVLGFDFPFFDQVVSEVFVTSYNAILIEEPLQAPEVRQFGDHELAAEQSAVIAPLRTTPWSQLAESASVRAARSADAVTITWTSSAHEVQAVLRRNGDIRFAYRRVTEAIVGAAVLITSGREAWRAERTAVAAVADAAGDVPSSGEDAVASMADITGVTVNRIAELDLLELRISTRAPINAAAMPADEFLLVEAAIGERPPFQYIRFWAQPGTSDAYSVTAWGYATGSSAARVEGSTLVLTFLDEHIADPRPLPVRVETIYGMGEDSVESFLVPFGGGTHATRTDFAGADGLLLEGRPIAESFTAAVLSPERVWQQVKQAYPHLTDDEIDGVAIYQNFYTDIVTYAGAYSTRGNSAASGLWPGDERSRTRPRTPALLHMNAIGHGHNRTLEGASRVLMHELGHRWLFSVAMMEDGDFKSTLNPLSAHPAQYVDTRAAFSVYTDRDTSVMGGGHFLENGDGTFTSGPYAPYGYSWLDLYLMGLAAPAEVPDFFYIANSSPRLGGAYYAPPNRTYAGTRRDVTLRQITDATGVRQPAYPETQRVFRMITVVVFDPEQPMTAAQVASLRDYMRTMEADFRTATSARASVSFDADPPDSKPRRRAVRK